MEVTTTLHNIEGASNSAADFLFNVAIFVVCLKLSLNFESTIVNNQKSICNQIETSMIMIKLNWNIGQMNHPYLLSYLLLIENFYSLLPDEII